jgi:hypothetical protein
MSVANSEDFLMKTAYEGTGEQWALTRVQQLCIV